MNRTHPTRRRLALLLVPLAVTTALAACGSDADDAAPADDAPATSGAGWTPVVVEGAYGDAEIEAEPTAVLPLSATDADLVLAAGVEPIGIPSLAQSDAATGGTGIYPWQEGLYAAGTPKLDAPASGLNIEAVAAMEPDLIVATAYFGLDEETFELLSEIAPVVHYDTEANADAWQDSARKVGEALGRTDETDAAIERAESTLADVRSENPALEGLTFNAVISPTADGVWVLCSEEDNMARVMGAFGLVLSDFAQTVECDGGKGEVSWENLSRLDADVLWVVPDTPGQVEVLEQQPLWGTLAAVQRGAFFVVAKSESVPFALAFPSPISLTWAVDQLAPKVAAAVA